MSSKHSGRSFQRLISVAVLPAVLAAVLLTFGCSKKGPSSSIQISTFDSAPAEIKQLAADAMTAWKAHRFAEAATNLVSLHAKAETLSPEQSEALTRMIGELGHEAFMVANKNEDPSAIQAVIALRAVSGRPGR